MAEKQKLSFGVQTNLTNVELFEISLTLAAKPAKLKLSTAARGRLTLEILDENEKSLLFEETDTFVSDNLWHRMSFAYQNQKIKFNSDGHSRQLKGNWKGLNFQSNAPTIGN